MSIELEDKRLGRIISQNEVLEDGITTITQIFENYDPSRLVECTPKRDFFSTLQISFGANAYGGLATLSVTHIWANVESFDLLIYGSTPIGKRQIIKDFEQVLGKFHSENIIYIPEARSVVVLCSWVTFVV